MTLGSIQDRDTMFDSRWGFWDGRSKGENFGFHKYKMAADSHLGYTKMS